MRNMMYIFISGYHKKYRENIYRTLFSPIGTINRYVFKSAGLVTVIHRLKRTKHFNQKALIVFVDRYGGSNQNEYVYYPIRNATLRKYVKEGNDRTAFYVELGDYIFPKNHEDIQGDFIRMGDIPKRSSATSSKDDGQYITIMESIIENEHYYSGTEGWDAAVKNLQTKRAFLAMEEEDLDNVSNDTLNSMVPFFYRLEYERKGFRTDKRIKPAKAPKDSSKGPRLSFHLSSKVEYQARIYYYFPYWAENCDVRIYLSMKSVPTQDDVQQPVVITYTNEMDHYWGNQAFSVPVKSEEFSFDVRTQDLPPGKTLVNFTQKISSQVRNRKAVKWFFIAFCAIIYVMCGFLLDYFGLPEDQSMKFFAYCAANWQQLLTSVIQILTVIFIALLNGGEGLLS